ncbi:MAG: 16S rRNA (cytidine(1402)-2'-O)-methyltransferase [Patescibacteria group bacterium]|nr:16S rRNA (cytidine(1402)-2'-O)-methyltransferase [Patescibacteria group bacterium]MDE2588794.1 16S rRNA (cytidine(1402)-2'-O)-methyltransferase [Patescibacteria group bacterium]
MIGTLYIVATPIGNLEDITVRAAKLLTTIGVIACEDTRHTGLLLDHLRKTYVNNYEQAPRPRLLSFYDDNEEQRIPDIIDILKSGQDIALVSDAGTPGVSDPGFTIIRACRQQGIPVTGLPGASAAILALAISGLPTDKFTFYGYLPKKVGNATKLLENIKASQEVIKTTTIFYEAPHKLVQSLQLLQSVLGDKEIVLARELTKVHEEVLQGTISSFLKTYALEKPRGEFVLLF